MKRICILIFSLWGVLFPSQAQEALDSIECSLITCSPGDEVYSLYGHTAIRCRNFTRNLDLVFNYGVFSFRQPHFIWRFVKGECDYMVDAMPWEYFPQDYERRGSSITAQILNLSQEESNHLFQSLLLNCQKENREYRYNFLYNNCTTKVRDKIESSINGTVEYLQGEEKKTYRQIIHEYTEHSPWAQDGNGRVGRLILFKECLCNRIVPFIITEELRYFYYRGLQNWPQTPGYLRDTCLTAQDQYKELMRYFRIEEC